MDVVLPAEIEDIVVQVERVDLDLVDSRLDFRLDQQLLQVLPLEVRNSSSCDFLVLDGDLESSPGFMSISNIPGVLLVDIDGAGPLEQHVVDEAQLSLLERPVD